MCHAPAGDADKTEYTLAEGLGARRLKQVGVRANVQSLLVQSCSSIYAHQRASMPVSAVKLIVEATRHICHHARLVRPAMPTRRRAACLLPSPGNLTMNRMHVMATVLWQ